MDDLAEEIGGNSQPLTVKIGEDVIFERVIEYINDKSFMQNGNVINI